MKQLLQILISTLMIATVSASAQATVALKTHEDRLSYAMGVETGQTFRTHNIKIQPDIFSQGLRDGLTGDQSLMSQEEIKKILFEFQQENIQRLKATLMKQSQENATKGQAFLEHNKTQPGVVTLPSGLQYKVLEDGTGEQPSNNDLVTVDYEGKLIDGKVFDSSYKRGKPVTFPVNAVIKGWQEALTLMHAGATWELYIPADLAYGERGAPGSIGPNEVLIFKVHLISVKKG